uniref:ATP-dependent RNA helicase n=1 Tax=Strongyloides venezuelensis TaxID=75913 RepID=A0A0K0FC69_STRVS
MPKRIKNKEKGPSGKDFEPRSYVVEEVKEDPIDYKAVGTNEFVTLEKAHMTLSWIEEATTFTPEINKEVSLKLKLIKNLNEELFEKIKLNIKRYFPVQGAVLPDLLEESVVPPILPPRDIAISAPTGSGKTLCYVLPILNSLLYNGIHCIHALIIVPVNQLVEQIMGEFKKYSSENINIVGLSNIVDHKKERKLLFNNDSKICTANIIITTPQRFMEHLFDNDGKEFDLTRLRYLVIDEADRMSYTARLDWLDTIEQKCNMVTKKFTLEDLTIFGTNTYLQKILVSATLNKDVEMLHMWNLRYPRLFHAKSSNAQEQVTESCMKADQIENALYLPSGLENEHIICDSKNQPLLLYYYLSKHPEWKSVIVFCDENEKTNRLPELLKILCKDSTCAHQMNSQLRPNKRVSLINDFKEHKIRVLVCSDAMSRGIDIQDLDCVINYGRPLDERQFIHRAGRTARAGNKGFLLNVVTPDEHRIMKKYLSDAGLWNKINVVKVNPIAGNDQLKDIYEKALEKYRKNMQNKNK